MTDTFPDTVSKIKLMIFDVDGVLTDGRLYFSESGETHKAFHSQDGIGLKMLLKVGIEVGIITGRVSDMVKLRMDELGVKHVYMGQGNKLPAYETLRNTLTLEHHQIGYMGDDLPDLAPMQAAGLAITVPNANPFIKAYADWITTKNGGEGAAREACEAVLKAQNQFASVCQNY